jgi:hypothetical protein
VVDAQNADLVSGSLGHLVPRQERSGVIPIRDDGVDRLSVGVHRRPAYRPELIFGIVWLYGRLRASPNGLGKREVSILNVQADILHAVAMFLYVLSDRAVGGERGRQDESRLVLPQHIGRLGAAPRLQTLVGDLREAESLAVVVGGLLGIPHIELNVVDLL